MEDYAKGKWNIIEQPFRHGDNLWIGSYIHIRPNVTVGNDVEIRDGVWLGPGVTIGNRVKVFNKSILSTETTIEDDVYIGPRVVFANSNFFGDSSGFKAPVVKKGAKIGAGAVILPNAIIEEGCIIGGGAVVGKPTEPYRMYIGNPARLVPGKDTRDLDCMRCKS